MLQQQTAERQKMLRLQHCVSMQERKVKRV